MAGRSPAKAGVEPSSSVSQMTFEDLSEAAAKRQLTIFAASHPAPCADLPDGTRTLLMLGPHEPGFWAAFTQSPEWKDGDGDAMDRWSSRVIGDWAGALGATAVFPFGGPPFAPFIRWATDSGWVQASPVSLLVHANAGLWVSFRGALALPYHIDLPPPAPAPCSSCVEKPCLTACPVGALGAAGYDVPACKAFLATDRGASCMSTGCQVRTACPVGQAHGRVASHSAYHMAHFI